MYQQRYRLRWGGLQTCSMAVDPSSHRRKVRGEYYGKENVNNKRTEAVSPLIRYMVLAMTQTAWLVRPCRDINKWRIVGYNTWYQLERHLPVPTLRIVNIVIERLQNATTFYTVYIGYAWGSPLGSSSEVDRGDSIFIMETVEGVRRTFVYL